MAALEVVVREIAKGRDGRVELVLQVDYKADGTITRVSMHTSSGIERLDAAFMTWASDARLCPSDADGSGRMPFVIDLNMVKSLA
ncbi:hypothetical protein [Lysobacter brunescens]